MRPFYAVLCVLALAAVPAQAKKPNFVFFLMDDLGIMDIGAYNPKTFYETPNIDKLAAAGMRFTNGYAANPVCSPTRFSIMTGKHPTRAGCTNFFAGNRVEKFAGAPLTPRMALDEVTLAEALKQAGYKTAHVGKWHLGDTEKFWPEAQGFDVNIGGHRAGSPASYFSPYKNPRLPDGPKGEELTQRCSDEAAKIIEQFKDEPFFLNIWLHSVHIPLQAPKELIEKYQAKAAKLDKEGDDFITEEQVHLTKEPRKIRIRQNHATYAAMVEVMDRAVGRVLDKLKELELDENTVVVFTSDNGGLTSSEGLPTTMLPFRGGKGWVYEGGIREPFLIRWPGVTKPGSTSDVPVVSTDFYPTMLDIAGVPLLPKQHLDGVSLLPILKGAGTLNERPLYWHYPHYSNQGGFPGGAIREGDWKLIERYEDGKVHLYNLKDDVGEQKDQAAAQPERVAALRKKLHAWYKDVDAKFLEPKENGPQPWRPE